MIEFRSLLSVDNHVCKVHDAVVSSNRFLWAISEYYEPYLQLGIHQMPHGQTAFDRGLLWDNRLFDKSPWPWFTMRYRCVLIVYYNRIPWYSSIASDVDSTGDFSVGRSNNIGFRQWKSDGIRFPGIQLLSLWTTESDEAALTWGMSYSTGEVLNISNIQQLIDWNTAHTSAEPQLPLSKLNCPFLTVYLDFTMKHIRDHPIIWPTDNHKNRTNSRFQIYSMMNP